MLSLSLSLCVCVCVCHLVYSWDDETHILDYLRGTTLVGLLPVPHPILIRRYQDNLATNMWFTTYMWGVIYLRNLQPPIFYGTHVKLFIIKMLDSPTQ